MSVRMALAKLCACACGGAVIGGGAMHVSQGPARAHYSAPHKVKKKVVRKRVAYKPQRRVVKRIRRTVTTTTQTSCAPATVTVASRGIGAPIPFPEGGPILSGGGGGGGPVVIGGSGGFGGGGFFGGFFGGGGGGGGGSIVVS